MFINKLLTKLDTINDRIKKIREKLGVNQSEFASSLGLKQGSYSDIERGKVETISSPVIFLLQQKYKVNIEYLYTGRGSMFKGEEKNNSEQISDNQNDPNMEAKEKELQMLRELLKSKDEIIKSKDETIEVLRGQSRSDYKGKSRQA